MLYDQLSPYVRSATASYLLAPYEINWRCLLDYELIYIQEGSFLLRTEQANYVCREGDVIFLPPGLLHRIECIGNVSVLQPHIHFDMVYDQWSPQVYVSYKPMSDFSEEDLRMLRPNLFSDQPIGPRLRLPNQQRFFEAMTEVISLHNTRHPLAAVQKKAAMLRLLGEFFEYTLSTTDRATLPEPDSALREVKDYIDHNAGSVITLDSLTMLFHYSKYHLERKFRELYGMSVIRYYHTRRIELAKETLLLAPSITAAAEKLSFGSVYLFSRFFHHHTGMSPTAFLRQAQDAAADETQL